MSGDERRPTPIGQLVGPWREPPGEDLSRILALTDGIFAIAMTLMVLNLTGLIPFDCGGPCTNSALIRALGGVWQPFLGYVIVFLVTGLYWTSHHRYFRYIERYDGILLWFNLLFLLTIAVLPFVLEIYNTYPDLPITVTLTSVTMAATGLLLGAMWFHATGSSHLVDRKLDARVITYYRRRGFILPVIFLAATPVAFVVPAYASFIWIASFPASVLLQRYGSA